MDYGSNTGGGDIQQILINNAADQAAASLNVAPVVTETIDLDAIYQATYEAEMAKYQAQIDAANQAATAAAEGEPGSVRSRPKC